MKLRLDALLVRSGLCSGRERAKEAIRAGLVFVDGVKETKPSRELEETALLELRGEGQKYVSRGGLKLEKALEAFDVDPTGQVCLDCGASTGGFTDCLLQHGAARVYALDVGSAQLAPSLLADARVVSMEHFNARDLRPEDLPETPGLIVADVSFISLRLVLPALARVLGPAGEIVCLIKPQFEAGRERLGKGGIVRDRAVHRQVLEELLAFFPLLGLFPAGLTWSPVSGGDGNLEFLCVLRREPGSFRPEVERIVEEAYRELK